MVKTTITDQRKSGEGVAANGVDDADPLTGRDSGVRFSVDKRASAKLCLGDENGDNVDESTSEGEVVAEGADGEGIGAASSRKKPKKRAKKSWQRERPVTRSVTQQTADNADESAQQEETPADVVNSVVEAALNIFARLCVAGTANNG
ncbi:hypothetical protein ON010_g13530 [Phytophthora cinnamomi]|nr:hypothetical protein ON010_g13530 [Phytophthora cinnamomi]